MHTKTDQSRRLFVFAQTPRYIIGMFRWLTCLFLATSVAHADPIPRRAFTGTTIQPLGKGIVSKKSHESLILACAEPGENCAQLQFLYAKSPTEVYQVGPGFETPSTEKELKRTLKRLEKNARDPGRFFFFMLAEVHRGHRRLFRLLEAR